jgi:gluconate 2-dehydrogenase gamma chain
MSTPLTASEADILEAIVTCLIPSDENGPGAAEARVSRYIERALATDYVGHRPAYASALAAVDDYARRTYERAFVRLSEEQRVSVLADMEAGSATGFEPSSTAFFELVRQHAMEGMFGDPRWGGNEGFVGWGLLGYPGVQAEWTEASQQLDAVVAPVYQAPARPDGASPVDRRRR